MDILTHVKALSFDTRAEWLADLQRFGDSAERTWKDLRKRKEHRLQDRAAEAKVAMDDVEPVMEWLNFGNWQIEPSRAAHAAISHIQGKLSEAWPTNGGNLV